MLKYLLAATTIVLLAAAIGYAQPLGDYHLDHLYWHGPHNGYRAYRTRWDYRPIQPAYPIYGGYGTYYQGYPGYYLPIRPRRFRW